MKFSTSIASLALFVASALAYPSAPLSTRAGAPKRGLVFLDSGLTRDFNSGEVSWAYNWDSAYAGNLPSGVNFFPMLWSAAPEHSNQWKANAEAAIARGSTHLLAFNEPDLNTQANMSPAAAAQAWMQFMQPFAGRATLVSPAVTNGAPPAMGTGWLDQFFTECGKLGCRVDAVAAHIYDSATNIAYYQSYISSLGDRYKRPVLITEFGAAGTVQQQQDFLKTMIPFMNGLSSVSHFAWFMVAANNLVNADGSLTPLGQTYVTA